LECVLISASVLFLPCPRSNPDINLLGELAPSDLPFCLSLLTVCVFPWKAQIRRVQPWILLPVPDCGSICEQEEEDGKKKTEEKRRVLKRRFFYFTDIFYWSRSSIADQRVTNGRTIESAPNHTLLAPTVI
jgi:hypothetical protein